MKSTKTQYIELTGKISWAKVYTPDEFRGAKRWTFNLYLDDDAEWKKFKDAGIQKKVKEDENGKFFNLTRPTFKLMAGKMVYFTPPRILDKDGKLLVSYVNEENKEVYSYEDENKVIRRVGEPVMIGNGSVVTVRLSVYPTAMGPGNRFESIKLIDLVHYEKPENPEDSKEEKGPEITVKDTPLKDKDSDLPPW